MRLTLRSEYALLALVYLGRRSSEGLISSAAIARAQQIPPRFLDQILLALKRAHLVRSVKGRGGGFQLAREPGAITLAEVVRLLDGPLAPTESVSRYFRGQTPILREKRLTALFREIRDLVADRMEHTTLADML
jgi:Rrf2 family protein